MGIAVRMYLGIMSYGIMLCSTEQVGRPTVISTNPARRFYLSCNVYITENSSPFSDRVNDQCLIYLFIITYIKLPLMILVQNKTGFKINCQLSCTDGNLVLLEGSSFS